jgi:hypothetical protein
MEAYEVFFIHFLEVETTRRAKAMDLLLQGKGKAAWVKYSHYVRAIQSCAEIQQGSLVEFLSSLKGAEASIPEEAGNVRIHAENVEDYWSDPKIELTWRTYEVEGIQKCKAIAKGIAKDYAWKLKHQPNGKDGRAAIELYEKLIKTT